jgi:H+/Cl- antiporter ClcA
MRRDGAASQLAQLLGVTSEKNGELGLKKSFVLSLTAVTVALLTSMSAVGIQMSSEFLADMRHGICVKKEAGDTRTSWHIALDGGWRPYDRTRCCGGSPLVDRTLERCRAVSIIQQTSNKKFAWPLKRPQQRGFGHFFESRLISTGSQLNTHKKELSLGATKSVEHQGKSLDEEDRKGQGGKHLSHRERSERLDAKIQHESERVRTHMSSFFAPDPSEKWTEETRHTPIAFNVEESDVSINEDSIQTFTESMGTLPAVHEWISWEEILDGKDTTFGVGTVYVLGSAILAGIGVLVTLRSPAAKGSGIPQVKASVAGFALPASFRLSTLVSKMVGLCFCVGAGLAIGPEGPMIHIGAIVGVLMSVILGRVGLGSFISETELVCVGAAAGVSAAFGAPIAGVIFVVEELGHATGGIRYTTMLCAFGSSMISSLILKYLDVAKSQRLALFEVDYKSTWAPWEAIPFCFLGVLGGVLGGFFVLANEAVHKRRTAAWKNGQLCWLLPDSVNRMFKWMAGGRNHVNGQVLEVLLLAAFTAASNFPVMITRILQNDGIFALFSSCPSAVPGHRMPRDPLGLCHDPNSPIAFEEFVKLLLGAAILRFLQCAVTHGASVPAGLFVPSLFIGGCFGRVLGAILKHMGMFGAGEVLVEPGVYAMVGAGAMLAGVSRMTISLTVVLFELTGGLTYIVPFMLSVLTAKWVGDHVTKGRSIYDVYATFNGLAKVEPPEELRMLNATLQDFGDDELDLSPVPLWANNACRADDLRKFCDQIGEEDGFTVLNDVRGHVEVMGWVDKEAILARLKAKEDQDNLWFNFAAHEVKVAGEVEDVSFLVNANKVVRVRPECAITTILCIFRDSSDVRAVVTLEGPPYTLRTITRSRFWTRLLNSKLPVVLSCPTQQILKASAEKTATGGFSMVYGNLEKPKNLSYDL